MMLAEPLREYIRACFTGLWIESHEHQDALTEIARVCRLEEWRLAVWDIDQGLQFPGQDTSESSGGDPLAAIRSINALAEPNSSAILVLQNFHKFLNSPEVIQAVARQVIAGRQNRTFLVVLSPIVSLPVELEKLFTVIEHELPNREQLEEIAHSVATEEGELPSGADLHAVLDASMGLTRFECENAVSLSLVRHGRVTPEAVWQIKAGALKQTGLVGLHRGGERFAQLGGLDNLKAFCLRAMRRQGEPDPLRRPRGVLLLSPPGCGKSQFAKALGTEVGRPTLTLDMGSLLGSLVGQSESNMRQALRIADAMAPCVLFCDEIEKALSGVASSGQTDSGVSSRLFGNLLSWLNDHSSDVFFVGTCNDISKLPPEFARAERFDAVFFIDFPSARHRESIWRIYLEQFNLDVSQSRPADENWSGAEVRACCRLAALLDVPLVQAAQNIVPIAATAGESISRLREWASGRCLSADVPGAAESFGADGDDLSAAKRLLDTKHPALKAVAAVRNRAVAYWKSLSLPYPEAGIRLIRQDQVETFDDQMSWFQQDLADAVAALDARYHELQSAARQRLGSLYDEHDYPESLRGLFSMGWEFPTVEAPDYLMRLNPELYEQQCRRVAARFDEAVAMAEHAFVDELSKLVSHLTERLTGQTDGKPKVFRDSAIENLSTFFERFRQLNVRSNDQLDALVDEAQQIVQGIRPQTLRDDHSLRQTVAAELPCRDRRPGSCAARDRQSRAARSDGRAAESFRSRTSRRSVDRRGERIDRRHQAAWKRRGGTPMIAFASRHPNMRAAELTGRDYLSYSAISTYQACPLKWHFRYVLGLPEDAVSASLVFGGAIHRAAELHFREILSGNPPPDLESLLAEYQDEWNERDLGTVQFGKGDDVDKLGHLAERVLAAFQSSELAQPKGQILGVEKELRGRIAAGCPEMLARVDLIVDEGDCVTVTDLKTSRSRWSQQQVEHSADQLILYAELAKELAESRGWHGALELVRQESLTALAQLTDRLQATRNGLTAPAGRTTLATAGDIYLDLVSLQDEFVSVTAEFSRGSLSATTEPIVLEGTDLGPFEIQLNWTGSGDPLVYRVLACEPRPAASSPDLLFLRDVEDAEVGGFGISAADDLLLVEDVRLIGQQCTVVSVEFEDDAVADFFDEQVDAGLAPNRFARIWLHTHPADSAEPSSVDEETFQRVFGDCDWAVMAILAQEGQTYARLRFNAGPGGQFQIPVCVDYTRPFPAADPESWQKEYDRCVRATPTWPGIDLLGDGLDGDADGDAVTGNWAEFDEDDVHEFLNDRSMHAEGLESLFTAE
eukprot:g10223.t1